MPFRFKVFPLLMVNEGHVLKLYNKAADGIQGGDAKS